VSENGELLQRAKVAFENSHSPYSHFRVGAAVRTEEGTFFTGTNIENASLGLTICAERVAIFNAISSGQCRQVMYEFSPHMKIHLEGNDKEIFRLTDLLPHVFDAKHVKR
jgi:cytidine deaminase